MVYTRDMHTMEEEQELEKMTEQKPDERKLLLQILKLQVMLQSKMFEFMRAYHGEHKDPYTLRDGSGRKTREGRLYDEVNELGVSLFEVLALLTGERLQEKRDEQGRVIAPCTVCKQETSFARAVDAPYGFGGAYIDGSERLVCTVCGKDTIYPDDERLPRFNSVFRTR